MATTGAELSRRTSTRIPFGRVVRRTVAGSSATERSETGMEGLDDGETTVAQYDEPRRVACGAVSGEPPEDDPRDGGWSTRSIHRRTGDRCVHLVDEVQRRQQEQQLGERMRLLAIARPEVGRRYRHDDE